MEWQTRPAPVLAELTSTREERDSEQEIKAADSFG